MAHYHLEKYHGPATKTRCPQCERRSLTCYVDEHNVRLDSTCGICDHKHSCGYHLPPREFFLLHPEKDTFRKEKTMNYLCTVRQPTPATPFVSVFANRLESEFVVWLKQHFQPARVEAVAQLYRLGTTRDKAVIFWQIDMQGNARDGKIMHYDGSGHRTGSPDWVVSRLRRMGRLPTGEPTEKGLFGEHLLTLAGKERVVCLVEAEKTAVICAILFPEFTWLATGGCEALNERVVQCLRGRRVVIYPDAGCLEKWKEKMLGTTDIRYSFVSIEHYPPNTDIADLLEKEVSN